jgi:histidinol-phosphate aminotransferase
VTDSRKTTLNRVFDLSGIVEGYDLGENIDSLARKLNRKPSEILKLNSNENFFVSLDLLRNLLKEVVDDMDPRLYPGDEAKELREALGTYVNASPETIVLGTGSDQLIDLVARAVLRPGDVALSIAPTFSIYEQCSKLQGATYKPILLQDDFSLDTEKMLSSVGPRTSLLFLCSPNNPTANQFDRKELTRLIEDFAGIVVIDEAYVEFAKDSVVDLVEESQNLVVLRTFSKAFGLAGLRLGYAIASREFVRIMSERLQLPYAVPHIAMRLGVKLLRKIDVIRSAVSALKVERSRLTKSLNKISGLRAFESETNFVLLSTSVDSNDLYRKLLEKGIIVKNLGRVLHLDNCLRVAVAPREMCERFLNSLREALGDMDA